MFLIFKEVIGQVFSIARDIQPVKGCTISKNICDCENSINVFSMAQNTDISAEIFPYHKLIFMHEGDVEVYESNTNQIYNLKEGDLFLTRTETPVGFKTDEGAIYTEVEIRKEDKMNEAINPGEVFTLAEKLPYEDGKIVNMDVIHNDKMKFALMAFDAGEGLSEHSAPGEALIFAFDGEGEIGYEGKTFTIKAGENFHFAKNGKHWVRAKSKFKMGLLLVM